MAFRLEAQIGADGSGFLSTMSKIEGRLGGLKRTLGTVFSVYAVSNFVRQVISGAEAIDEMSDRLKVSAEWLERLQFVAKQYGADMGDVAKAIENLNAAREDVLSGSPKGQDLFRQGQKLGLGKMDWTLRSEDIFLKIAEAIRKGDPQTLSPALNDLVGKPFRGLLTMMSSDIQAQMADAKIMGDAARAALAETADRFDRMKSSLIAMSAGPLAKILEFLSKAIVGWAALSRFVGTFIGDLWGELNAGILQWMKGDKFAAAQTFKGAFSGEFMRESWDDAKQEAVEAMEKWSKLFGVDKPWTASAKAPTIGQWQAPSWGKTGKGWGLESTRTQGQADDQLRVGNILGRNANAIQSVWQEQIRIGNKQVFLQEAICKQAELINTALKTVSGGTLGIPGI